MEQAATLELPQAAAPERDEVDQLLQRAWANDPQNTDQLNQALRTLPAYGPTGEAMLGQRLLSLLESRRLALMVGTDGSCAETHAAARLLELGFPWALHLTPELLVRVRALPKKKRSRPRALGFGLSAVASGFAVVHVMLGLMSITFSFWASLAALVANVLFATGRLDPKKFAIGSGLALFIGWLAVGSSPWPDEGVMMFILLAPFAVSVLAAVSAGAGQVRKLE